MIDINCDMGEGMGNEELLMPFINSANIACGYHAGDETTMQRVIELCLKHNVNIGAHPSFLDRVNFGRTEMQLPASAIYQLVTEQLELINKIALRWGGKLHHIKPHGALYNMAAKDAVLAKAIAQAVKDFDASLIYYGLSGSVMIMEAARLGLQTANEVFADRTYQPDGTLTPRSLPNALLSNTDDAVKQAIKFVKENKVVTGTGEEIIVKADTICIHGDGKNAVKFAKAIYQQLHEK
ncbi:MAG: 5-oxoprolinase subunit PxpA [Ferruginibacter sp.]